MENMIRQQFQQYFGKECLVAAAPGRVNLIGEHTDYNQGFVLPAAIDRYMYVAIAENETGLLEMYAREFDEHISFAIDDIHPVQGWATYLLGMVYQLMPEKLLPKGLDVYVTGNVPVGAGMSSSAALCSAFGLALNSFYKLGFSKMEIALAGQQTEHQFAKLQCGIMDQFASLHGKAGQLMKLDCRNLEYEYIPFHFPECRIVLVNTMVSHSLASSEYNLRRQQCEEGVSVLKTYYPEIHSLRDVKISQLNMHQAELSAAVFKRCLFIVEENQRLLEGCHFLRHNDLDSFGRLMYAAHDGLSRDYEVSCPESDFLVAAIKNMEGVKGARQMGGGFGGCIITLIESSQTSHFIPLIQKTYETAFGKTPDCYNLTIGDGARVGSG
jgi:galactokinase